MVLARPHHDTEEGLQESARCSSRINILFCLSYVFVYEIFVYNINAFLRLVFFSPRVEWILSIMLITK